MTSSFIAIYESRARVDALAASLRFDSDDGDSWHDFIEDHFSEIREARTFSDCEQAVEWVRSEVAAAKSVYGSGRVIERRAVPVGARCQYCTCRGMLDVRELTISDEGVDDDRPSDEECFNDD